MTYEHHWLGWSLIMFLGRILVFELPKWPGIQHFLRVYNCKYLPTSYLICLVSQNLHLAVWGWFFIRLFIARELVFIFFRWIRRWRTENIGFCRESIFSVQVNEMPHGNQGTPKNYMFIPGITSGTLGQRRALSTVLVSFLTVVTEYVTGKC